MSPDQQPDDELDAAVHRADLDELIRLIDRRTQARDWSGLSRTRRSCAAAVDTGRQARWTQPVGGDRSREPETLGAESERAVAAPYGASAE